MGERILILGNGFDLAHGLPTAYSDFLEFSKCVIGIYDYEYAVDFGAYKKNYIDEWICDDNSNVRKIKDDLTELFKSRVMIDEDSQEQKSCIRVTPRLDRIYNCLIDNLWYKYIWGLYNDNLMRGENWIDFEAEISYIIQVIEGNYSSVNESVQVLLKGIELIDERTNRFRAIYLSKCLPVYNTRNKDLTIRNLRSDTMR